MYLIHRVPNVLHHTDTPALSSPHSQCAESKVGWYSGVRFFCGQTQALTRCSILMCAESKDVQCAPQLSQHTSVFYAVGLQGPSVYVYGGKNSAGTSVSSLWLLNVNSLTWSEIKKEDTHAVPAAADAGEANPLTLLKEAPPPTPPPPPPHSDNWPLPRFEHSATVIGDVMYVMYGRLQNDPYPNRPVWLFSLTSYTWKTYDLPSVVPQPVTRGGHAASNAMLPSSLGDNTTLAMVLTGGECQLSTDLGLPFRDAWAFSDVTNPGESRA